MSGDCSITGCGKPAVARTFCGKHYKRWRDHGDPLKTLYDVDHTRGCSTPGCRGAHYAKGLCQPCYQRSARAGRKLLARRPPGRPASTSNFPAVPAAAAPCWAAGCHVPPTGQDGLCEEHEHLAEEWNADAEEALVTCCFKGCGEMIDPETFGWEFPCCPHHLRLTHHAMELEEWGVTKEALSYLEFDDWLSAKWIAAILGREEKNRQWLDRVIGETPLFKVITSTLGDLYPVCPFLG